MFMMDICKLLDEVKKANTHMNGGRATQIETLKFWMITQHFVPKLLDFDGFLYPTELGRSGRLDSPYTLVTCRNRIAHNYCVERIDFNKVKERARVRSGLLLRFPIKSSSTYEALLLSFNELAEPVDMEFEESNNDKYLKAWIDFRMDC